MDFGSKLSQSKEYNTPVLRQNYSSTNARLLTPNQRLDEIRKKYDTPTRKQLKQIQVKNNVIEKPQVNQDMDLRKSTQLGEMNREKYANPTNKMHEMSPASGYRKQNLINQQETIFKKIKEMKDSLLDKNGNDKIKTTKSIYQPKAAEKIQPRPHMADHRLQNIDRINAKFQQILSCLRESQTKTPLLESQFIQKSKDRADGKQNIKASDLKFSPIPAPKTSQFAYQQGRNSRNVTQFQSQTFTNQSNTSFQGQANKTYQQYQSRSPNLQNIGKIEVRNTASMYQEDKKYKVNSPANKNFDNIQTNSNKGESKVRSFINITQKQAAKGVKYQMRSGKKLDDQINKIQSKIQQFQQQKRRLNIDFKPYSHSNSKSSSNLTKRSYTIDKFQGLAQNKPPSIPNDTKKSDDFTKKSMMGYEKYYQRAMQGRNVQTKTIDSNKIAQMKTAGRFTMNQQLKERKHEQSSPSNLEMTKKFQKYQRSMSENDQLFKIKLIPVEGQQKNSATNSRVQNIIFNQDLKKRTDQGILDRKKRLTNTQVSRSKTNIKKLVQKLSAQAQLDQVFRNNKLYFESNMNTKKWTQLQEQIKRNGITIDKQKLQKLFKITDQQNNPFFSVRQNVISVNGLVKSYIECQQHWKKEIIKKISRQQLLGQQFTCDSLDLQKKGYIVLEDIVRFLNMETGTFYRNRDLYLIFKRINEHDKINFNQLIETFCK